MKLDSGVSQANGVCPAEMGIVRGCSEVILYKTLWLVRELDLNIVGKDVTVDVVSKTSLFSMFASVKVLGSAQTEAFRRMTQLQDE